MTKRHAIISRRNIGSEVEQEFIFKVVAFIKNVNKFSIVKLHNELVNVSVWYIYELCLLIDGIFIKWASTPFDIQKMMSLKYTETLIKTSVKTSMHHYTSG